MLAAHAETVNLHDAEDLEMQVRVDGSTWHRKAVGGHQTACGLAINYRHTVGLRHESYLGQICRDGCYSSYELSESDRLNEEAAKAVR